MARKHPKNLSYDEIENLVQKYKKEAYRLKTNDLEATLQEINEEYLYYSFIDKHSKAYYLWVKVKVFTQVLEQKVKRDMRNKKIDDILLDM